MITTVIIAIILSTIIYSALSTKNAIVESHLPLNSFAPLEHNRDLISADFYKNLNNASEEELREIYLLPWQETEESELNWKEEAQKEELLYRSMPIQAAYACVSWILYLLNPILTRIMNRHMNFRMMICPFNAARHWQR